MQSTVSKALFPAAGALALGACSVDLFTQTIGRYGEVKGIHVRLGCNDTYEVFDRPDAQSLLVVTNGVNETIAGSCGGLAAQPQPVRMRQVATIYLEEKLARPECRITRDTRLSELHTEVEYRCPARASARRQPGLRGG